MRLLMQFVLTVLQVYVDMFGMDVFVWLYLLFVTIYGPQRKKMFIWFDEIHNRPQASNDPKGWQEGHWFIYDFNNF